MKYMAERKPEKRRQNDLRAFTTSVGIHGSMANETYEAQGQSSRHKKCHAYPVRNPVLNILYRRNGIKEPEKPKVRPVTPGKNQRCENS
jgi:hypothetical protein